MRFIKLYMLGRVDRHQPFNLFITDLYGPPWSYTPRELLLLTVFASYVMLLL